MYTYNRPILETIQEFLEELAMKQHTYAISLNHVNIRLSKIINNLLKDLKILIFKVIFSVENVVESFFKKCFKIFD